jgi:hypothetical protein
MSSPLQSLPPELLSAIAARLLTASDVVRLAQTCRDARDACWAPDADCWRELSARRWGPLANGERARDAAAEQGGWRQYFLRRSSLRLWRGGPAPPRPASAKVLFWGEEGEDEEEEAAARASGGAADDAEDAADADDKDQQQQPQQQNKGQHHHFVDFAAGERSPLDLVQEAYQSEPWRVVCACMLIARTSGGATPLATIADFFRALPTPSDVAAAGDARVEALLQPLGLQRNRRASVKAASSAFLGEAWRDPSELKGCGKFVSDSWRVFCRGETGAAAARSVDDPMLRRFARWCAGGGGGGGAEEKKKDGGGGSDALKRRRETAAAAKGKSGGEDGRRQRQRGGDREEAAAALVVAAAGGRVTRGRVAAAVEAAQADKKGSGGRSLRAAARRG